MTNFVVSSGVTSSGIELGLSDTLQIQSGGIASGTVASGGSGYVSGASFFTSLTTFSASTEIIFSGGSATQTTVNAGQQVVSSGGIAISTTVNNFNGLVVSNGGIASAAYIDLTATISVLSGGVTSNTSALGAENVGAGGKAFGTILLPDTAANTQQNVDSGGLAVGTLVGSHSFLNVSAGGTASNAVLASGGLMFLRGTGSGTVVSGGSETVVAGGLALFTTVNSGGVEILSSGGQAGDTLSGPTAINSGGVQQVLSSGRALGAVVTAAASRSSARVGLPTKRN